MSTRAVQLAIESELDDLAGVIVAAEKDEARRLNWTMLGASPAGLLLVFLGLTGDHAAFVLPLAVVVFAWSAWQWRRADWRVQQLHRLRGELEAELDLLQAGDREAGEFE